jgi:hypothetical protein
VIVIHQIKAEMYYNTSNYEVDYGDYQWTCHTVDTLGIIRISDYRSGYPPNGPGFIIWGIQDIKYYWC